MKNIEIKQKEFVAVAKEMFGDTTTQVSRKDVVQMITTKGVQYPVWLLKSPEYRIGRGQYSLPTFAETMSESTDEIQSEIVNDSE
jgi:hypothetical protein|tara:strand:+ start:2883 stop:3137 length:255 start_codon:yes stop_codon:yes gene_type:complete